MKKILAALVLFSIVGTTFGQLTNMPLSKSYNDYFAQPLLNSPHSAIQPFSPFEARSVIDSIQKAMYIENNFTQTWLGRKLLNENMANVEGDDFHFILNPLFDLRQGRDNLREKPPYFNTRGVQVSAFLGENIAIYTDVHVNSIRFPQYIEESLLERDVIPGYGDFKRLADRTVTDFNHSSGFLAFRPNKFMDFQLGYGKHFIGDGYRSILLSDNSFNYPYLRMTTSFWKIRYVNLFTQMLDVNTLGRDQTYTRKYVTSHYLSAEVTKKLTLSLFETVIYHDSTGTRGYDINYLNPFILYRPVEFMLGSLGGNVLIGGAFKYQLTPDLFLYGQGMIDELLFREFFGGNGWWGNKYSLQGGFKSFNTFIDGLMLQSEFNFSRPYTYTHRTELQNYGHYNQPLSHPLGANFVESVTIARYLKNRWFGEFKFVYAIQGLDEEGENWGADIYQTYETREQNEGNTIGQGTQTTITVADVRLGYIVNPTTNWRLQFGYTYRSFQPESKSTSLSSSTTHFFHFGIVTQLANQYHDY